MIDKTEEMYDSAFTLERDNEYEEISAFEDSQGIAIERDVLENMARVLACPVKKNPPNWQHGRVLYSLVARMLLDGRRGLLLDIGTAKGFSACVMAHAVADTGSSGTRIVSVDIVDPDARVVRNTIAEVLAGAPLSVYDVVSEFVPDGAEIEFHGGGSLPLLKALVKTKERVMLAFVDGKHNYEAVMREVELLRYVQEKGDVIVFDDLQIVPVANAVKHSTTGYRVRHLRVNDIRQYAIAVRV